MRRYEVRLTPEGGWFHPFEGEIARTPGVRRVAIHKMRLITDDLGLMLYELSGDADRAAAVVDDLLDWLGYQLSEIDGRIFVYAGMVPNDTVRTLLRIVRDFRVFLDPPMIYTRDGALVVTCIATEASFADAVELVPDDVDVTLEHKSEFRPGGDVFRAKLTDVQREVFETAIELGYYDSPRRATYADVGRVLDLAGSTVGEHLRKVEAALVSHVVTGAPGRPDPEAVGRAE